MDVVLLTDVATTSAAVAAAPGRLAKVALLADCLRTAARSGDHDTIEIAVAFLSGELRQRRTGLAWAALRGSPTPTPRPATLTVAEVDATFARSGSLAGPGSTTARRSLLHDLLGRATPDEARLLAGLVTGELRQGAQASVLTDAVAAAAGVAPVALRRALTLSGSLGEVAVAVLTDGPVALAGFALVVGRGLAPMLAASAPDLTAALAVTGPAALEWKLDGVRVQVHRDGAQVTVLTRTLDDITARLPEIVQVVRSLPVASVVLDGEAIALHPDGRPMPFQQTASRVATRGPRAELPLSLLVFDLLHLDGDDVTVEPARHRRELLERVAAPLAVPRLVVDPAAAAQVAAGERFVADALARGHEGVVVKALDAPYASGRRGAGWVKVKPVHTLDLVVLAAEWGHGRRTGRLSNLHLGARDPDGRYGAPGAFVMLGKTFKGLSDALLAWQTDALTALAVDGTAAHVVRVRPELVVEIALDGVQTSPRYPAGVALRFARVVRYRDDKGPDDADTVDTVRALLAPGSAP